MLLQYLKKRKKRKEQIYEYTANITLSDPVEINTVGHKLFNPERKQNVWTEHQSSSNKYQMYTSGTVDPTQRLLFYK